MKSAIKANEDSTTNMTVDLDVFCKLLERGIFQDENGS